MEVPLSSTSSVSSKGSSVGGVPAYSSSTLYGQRKLREEAENELFKNLTEKDALEHLSLTKPTYLVRDGSDVWLNQKDVDAKMSEIMLKFKINSLGDRADRLNYLLSVLKKKWANKPETYESMLTFMMEISSLRTDNFDLKVGRTKYSSKVEMEIDESTLYGEELRKEIVDELLELRVPVTYSSEEELIDWGFISSNEDEAESVKNQIPPSTTSPVAEISEVEKNEHVTTFRSEESEKGDLYLNTHLRQVEPMPLNDQPVISSPMALNTRFGEYWEWKKASASNQRPQIMLLSENDIIRELISQVLSPSCMETGTTIFTSAWNLRPEIVLKTLPHSSLKSFADTYGHLCSKLQRMHRFIRICSVADSCPPVFRSYSSYLFQVLTFVTEGLDGIERSVKMDSNPEDNSPLPTTLVQLNQALEPITKLISPLEQLHSQAICCSDSVPNWFKGLRLISCLELHLSLITDPPMYGLLLYLFSKCLLNSLCQILLPLQLTDWDNNEFLFRKSTVKITDPNFWNEVITLQPITDEFTKINLQPISFLNWILPKIRNILKVQEMINQLGTGVGLSCQGLLFQPLPSYKVIVTQFLDDLLGREGQSSPSSNVVSRTTDFSRQKKLDSNLRCLNLENTTMHHTFRTLLRDLEEDIDVLNPEIKEFHNIDNIPLIQTRHPLQKSLETHLDPFFRSAHASLSTLFQSFNVADTIRLLQEIMFGGKEEFALACIRLAFSTAVHAHRKEKTVSPNIEFQKLLHQVYPEGRRSFEIEFLLESQGGEANFWLKIHPQFPLTLLLPPPTITRYENVAKDIFKIRKGLWLLNRLDPKHCKPPIDVEVNRILLIRFAMIHFWTSLRSFVLFSIFDPNKAITFDFNVNSDIDEILKVYESESGGDGEIYRILSMEWMDSEVLKPMLFSSLMLSKKWKTGIPLTELVDLGARVKSAWGLILEFGSSSSFPEMNEFFGPIPENIF